MTKKRSIDEISQEDSNANYSEASTEKNWQPDTCFWANAHLRSTAHFLKHYNHDADPTKLDLLSSLTPIL